MLQHVLKIAEAEARIGNNDFKEQSGTAEGNTWKFGLSGEEFHNSLHRVFKESREESTEQDGGPADERTKEDKPIAEN